MKIIYAIMNNGGSYEDSWDFIDKAFFDEDEANAYLKSKNEWLKKQKEIEEAKMDKEYTNEELNAMTYDEYTATLVDYQILYEQCNFYIKEIKVY